MGATFALVGCLLMGQAEDKQVDAGQKADAKKAATDRATLARPSTPPMSQATRSASLPTDASIELLSGCRTDIRAPLAPSSTVRALFSRPRQLRSSKLLPRSAIRPCRMRALRKSLSNTSRGIGRWSVGSQSKLG